MEEWERKLRQKIGAMTGRQALKHMIKLQSEVRRLSFAVEAKSDENKKLKLEIEAFNIGDKQDD